MLEYEGGKITFSEKIVSAKAADTCGWQGILLLLGRYLLCKFKRAQMYMIYWSPDMASLNVRIFRQKKKKQQLDCLQSNMTLFLNTSWIYIIYTPRTNSTG